MRLFLYLELLYSKLTDTKFLIILSYMLATNLPLKQITNLILLKVYLFTKHYLYYTNEKRLYFIK